jgi:hypothetical protein
MQPEEKIENALLTRVASLSFVPPIPVKLPNDDSQFPGQTYIEVAILRNTNEMFATKAGGTNRFIGILQLTVVAPLGEGPSNSTRIGGGIAGHFPAGLALFYEGVKVNIIKRPSLAGPFKDRDVSWNLPVSIEFDALA